VLRPSVRFAPLLACSLAALLHSGCANSGRSASTQAPSALVTSGNLELDVENFFTLEPNDPRRAETARALVDRFVELGERALTQDDLSDATSNVEEIGALYPGATASSIEPHASAAAFARKFYAQSARRGDVERATLGLNLLATFGSAQDQSFVEREWKTLLQWFALGESMGPEEGASHDLQLTLEIASTLLPGRWIVKQLDSFYDREQAALAQGLDQRKSDRERMAQQATANAYFRLRALLRTDQLDAARRSLDQFEMRFGTALSARLLPLRLPLAQAARASDDSVRGFLDLIQEFSPGADDRLAPWQRLQSWQIVAVLARHALARDDQSALAKLALARVHSHANHPIAALRYYESIYAASADLAVWVETANNYHFALLRQLETADGLALARPLITRIEEFHVQARKRWPNETLIPGTADLQAALAHAYYDQGEPRAAAEAAQASLQLQLTPEVLTLLGTVEARNGDYATARKHFDSLQNLPSADPIELVHWKIVGQLQLAEVEMLAREPGAANRHWQHAKTDLDALLDKGHLDDYQAKQHLSLRAGTLMYLNQPRAALADIRRASKLDHRDTEIFRATLSASYLVGETAAAVELFELARKFPNQSPNTLVYYALWVHDMLARSPQASASKEVREFLERVAHHKPSARSNLENDRSALWCRYLAQHALGEISGSDLRKLAHSPGEKTEAYFYEALALRAQGNDAAARPLLEEVLATKMVSFSEYRFTQWILASPSVNKAASNE
jgi:lipoprotein NlpI